MTANFELMLSVGRADNGFVQADHEQKPHHEAKHLCGVRVVDGGEHPAVPHNPRITSHGTNFITCSATSPK